MRELARSAAPRRVEVGVGREVQVRGEAAREVAPGQAVEDPLAPCAETSEARERGQVGILRGEARAGLLRLQLKHGGGLVLLIRAERVDDGAREGEGRHDPDDKLPRPEAREELSQVYFILTHLRIGNLRHRNLRHRNLRHWVTHRLIFFSLRSIYYRFARNFQGPTRVVRVFLYSLQSDNARAGGGRQPTIFRNFTARRTSAWYVTT